MIGWRSGNIDLLIGNLFPKPMLPNIHMFELGDERWQIFGE
jgi:hypothetical protein